MYRNVDEPTPGYKGISSLRERSELYKPVDTAFEGIVAPAAVIVARLAMSEIQTSS